MVFTLTPDGIDWMTPRPSQERLYRTQNPEDMFILKRLQLPRVPHEEGFGHSKGQHEPTADSNWR